MESANAISASAQPRTTSQRIKSIFSGSVGNLVEWYDWYVYAAFSLYFAKAFFPQGDMTAQLLNTAAIFAVGFLMRPIGGWLMGIYADRKGRKAALLASVLLMCFGSLIIALTPSYETIGVAAPILLVVARLLQGLSVGGEYGTSATYLSEMANKEQRGFFSSFQYVTLISGQLIALAVLIVLQQTLTVEQLESWGWRVPFFIGALCAVVAMFLRRGMEETESFSKKKEEPKESLLRTLLRHPKEVLTVVGLTMGGTLAFYTYTTYMQKYLVNTVGMSKTDSTMISAATLFLFMLLQPIVGACPQLENPIYIGHGISTRAEDKRITYALRPLRLVRPRGRGDRWRTHPSRGLGRSCQSRRGFFPSGPGQALRWRIRARLRLPVVDLPAGRQGPARA